MKPTNKFKSKPTTDHAARVAATAAELELRTGQRADALQQLASAITARDEAQGSRDALRLRALADGDVEAKRIYEQASATYRTSADLADELTALAEQLAGEVQRLEAEHRAARQDEVRAVNLADGQHAAAHARAIDEAAKTMLTALQELRAVRVRQVQRAVDAELPDAECSRYHNFKCLLPLRELAAEFGIRDPDRPRHHAFREMSVEQLEVNLQRGVGTIGIDDIDETPTDTASEVA